MAAITIPLFYDLDLLLWTSAAGGIARQPNLVLGQSDSIAFAVQFVRSGVVIDLTSPAWICGIKPINDTAGNYLCQTTTGVKTGSGTTTVYTFTLLLDSTELRAWLLTVTAVSNYAAFSIRDTVNLIATLPAITCTILPDYTLTGATPVAGSGTLVVDSGATFTVHKSFAMPTDNGVDTYVLKTNGAGVGSWVAQSTSTGTVTSVAQSFTGGIVSVGGSPVTTSGTLALTVTGTQGGLVYFTSTSTWDSTGSLSLGGLVIGGGTGIPTVLSAALSGRVLTSAGVNTTPSYSSTITLGASGTLGTITLGNATSGTILISPPTGALGTPTLTLPITTTTLAGLSVVQTFTGANTFSSTVSLTLDTDATSSSSGGTLTVTGGAAVSKKLFVGLSATIGGALTVGGHILPSLDSAYDIGQSNQPRFRDIYCVGTATMQYIACASQAKVAELADYGNTAAYMKTAYDSTHDFYLFNRATTHIPFSINAVTSQTADLFHCYVNAVQKFAVSTAGTITLAGGVVFGSFTVSTFPATIYFEAVVTNALVPVVGSAVAAGGSAKCKVMYNGSEKIVTAVL